MLEINETRTITPVQSEQLPEETNMNKEHTHAQGIDIDFNSLQFEAVESKHWYQSKTMWLNLAVTGLGVASTVAPVLRPFVNPRTFGMITTGIGVANTLLRMVTHKPIKGGKGHTGTLPTANSFEQKEASSD